MEVDGPGVDLQEGARLVHGAEQGAGAVLDDEEQPARRRSDVDGGVRCVTRSGVEPAPSLDQITRCQQVVGNLSSGVAEERQLLRVQRLLPGRASEVRPEHVRVRRVDHRRLGRLPEQVRRMGHEVLVQRIVLGHQHRQRGLRPPPGPARLLPHRGARSRVARKDRRVQGPDVDPQLERRGRRHRQQIAVRQSPLQGPALFRQVPGPVRLHPAGQCGGKASTGGVGQDLGGPA
jgi:hypothetical protein